MSLAHLPAQDRAEYGAERFLGPTRSTMKRHPGRGISVVALLMLSGGVVNAVPFGWEAHEAARAVEDPGLTVEDKVTLVSARAATAISDEDDCTHSTAGGTTAAASGRCTRG
jgi:hypothetical protein